MRREDAQTRLALVLCVAGAVIGGVLGMSQRTGAPHPPPPLPAQVGGGTVDVHVVGWVVSPGVVSVPVGSLVVDAVLAAGGLRPGAIVEAVNLASQVTSGQQIVVPGPGGAPGPAGGGRLGSGKVAVNRATSAELEALPGVGPVLAERIVDYREHHGPFGVVEDLLGVPGIGEAKLAAIRDLITIP